MVKRVCVEGSEDTWWGVEFTLFPHCCDEHRQTYITIQTPCHHITPTTAAFAVGNGSFIGQMIDLEMQQKQEKEEKKESKKELKKRDEMMCSYC